MINEDPLQSTGSSCQAWFRCHHRRHRVDYRVFFIVFVRDNEEGLGPMARTTFREASEVAVRPTIAVSKYFHDYAALLWTLDCRLHSLSTCQSLFVVCSDALSAILNVYDRRTSKDQCHSTSDFAGDWYLDFCFWFPPDFLHNVSGPLYNLHRPLRCLPRRPLRRSLPHSSLPKAYVCNQSRSCNRSGPVMVKYVES